MSTVKDKIVVIADSTRGYGFTIAESMLEAGATVAITGRSQQAVDNSLASLQPKGRVSGFVMDVCNEKQVYKLDSPAGLDPHVQGEPDKDRQDA